MTFIVLLLSSTPAHSLNFSNNNDLESNDTTKVFGYVISVDACQNNTIQSQIFQTVNELLGENIDVYWTKSELTLLSKGFEETDSVKSIVYEKGSYIISYTEDHEKNLNITSTVYKQPIKYSNIIYNLMEPVLNLDANLLREPRIAHYDEDVVMTNTKWFLEKLGFENQEKISITDIINNNLTLDKYDIFFIGGASGRDKVKDTLVELRSSDWKLAKKKIRSFVEDGGNYIGICHGSARSATKVKKPVGPSKDLKYSNLLNIFKSHLGLIDCSIYRAFPGGGNIDVEFEDMSHPITYGLPSVIRNHSFAAGPIFTKMLGSSTKTLGVVNDIDRESWNYSYWMDESFWYVSDKVPQSIKDNKIDRWMDYCIGKSVWVENDFGNGKAIAFGGHPEFGVKYAYDGIDDGELTDFPVRVLANAVYYLCSEPVSNVNLNHFVTFSNIYCEINSPSIAPRYLDLTFSADLSNYTSSYYCCWDSAYISPYETFEESYELNMTRRFDFIGNYTMVFCIIDNDGSVSVKEFNIEIIENIRITSPWSRYDIIYYGYTDEPLFFSANITNGIEPITYIWDFGDGNTSNGKNANHTYSSIGIYRGYFEVNDTFSDWDGFFFRVIINDRNPSFTFNVSIAPTILQSGVESTATITVDVSTSGNYSYFFNYLNNYYKYYSNIEGSSFSINHTFLSHSNFFHFFVTVSNEFGETYCVYKKITLNLNPYIYISSPISFSHVRKNNEIIINGQDFECEDFYIRVDYGDNYIDSNNETLQSVKQISEKEKDFLFRYSWDEPGEYIVKAQAIDENGFKSEWKELFVVKVDRIKISDIIIDLLEKIGLVDIN